MYPRILPVLALLFIAGCADDEGQADSVRSFTVLYTNDEHGWMEGMSEEQGAANLYQLWQDREGYTPEGDFLILSGGDNWTGPAVSTWTEGESMVAVMNAMQYDASAVGNHEFDFGLQVLSQRATESAFPYLSANIRYREDNSRPVDLGILPHTVTTVNDLRVGIIGLSTTSTPAVTHPLYVEPFEFPEYEGALRAAYTELDALDVDVTLVIAHVCMGELRELAEQVADLDIAMMGGGHCNELVAQPWAETLLLGGGFHFTSYAKASFAFDVTRGELVARDYATEQNSGAAADSMVSEIVAGWLAETEAFTSEYVAYNAAEMPRSDLRFSQAIIDSWLIADPTADVAITNAGGFRISLPAGEITIGTLVALMPFENTIVALNLSGAELISAANSVNRPVIAGIEELGGVWVETSTGANVDPEKIYRVLVNSFIYAGGDNYDMLREYDPDGFDTGINYRQPFVDWLVAQGSTPDQPLDWETTIP